MLFVYSKKAIILLLSCLMLTCTSNISANEDQKSKKYQCKVISKNQAIANAKRRSKGKVVAANLSKKGDRSVYKVRLLINNKRVKTITIPACQ